MEKEEIKKTMIIGASNNPNRYSYVAANRLTAYDHPIVPVGKHKGRVAGKDIVMGFPQENDIHTVTMYINQARQADYYDYILSLKPRRVIFNPGAENPEFADKLRDNGVEVVDGCTLVMLTTKQF